MSHPKTPTPPTAAELRGELVLEAGEPAPAKAIGPE